MTDLVTPTMPDGSGGELRFPPTLQRTGTAPAARRSAAHGPRRRARLAVVIGAAGLAVVIALAFAVRLAERRRGRAPATTLGRRAAHGSRLLHRALPDGRAWLV